ncbi:hypothetical protein ABIF74_008846 [Bradyrhizobium japonicum]
MRKAFFAIFGIIVVEVSVGPAWAQQGALV